MRNALDLNVYRERPGKAKVQGWSQIWTKASRGAVGGTVARR